MKITLLAISDRMPRWVEDVFEDYQKRFIHPIHVELLSLPAPKRGATLSTEKAKALEGRALLDKIPANAHVVLLDEAGKLYASRDLAKQVDHWQALGKPVVIVIGGADGFDSAVYERAQEQWSLSPLTFPHPLVRILAIEQLYRAFSILKGHPYHRGS